jgi:hypothetical protein
LNCAMRLSVNRTRGFRGLGARFPASGLCSSIFPSGCAWVGIG